jgi:hypothetical protein
MNFDSKEAFAALWLFGGIAVVIVTSAIIALCAK